MKWLEVTPLDRLRGDATALELALRGVAPAPPRVVSLVALAHAASTSTPAVPASAGRDAARARMLSAVAEKRALAIRRRRAHGRAAAFAGAAVAGGGLLIASAANGTDPVTLVRDTVHSLPGVVGGDGAERVTLEGTVVAIDADARAFALRTTGGDIRVVTTSETQVLAASGARLAVSDIVAGAAVRVRGVRFSGRAVEAREVVIHSERRPEAAPAEAPRDATATREPAPPAPSPGRDGAGDTTRPPATPTATPTLARGDTPTPERTVADRPEPPPGGRTDQPTPTPTPPSRR